MAGVPSQPTWTLEQCSPSTPRTFAIPNKRINDGDDLNFFLASKAYRDLKIWVVQLNRALFPVEVTGAAVDVCSLDSPPSYSAAIQSLRALLQDFDGLILQAPLDTGPRRFGNVAFRSWYRLAEAATEDLLQQHLGDLLEKQSSGDQDRKALLKDELKAYLLGSFGSAQRLDYGTGHELSFLAFLGSLWKLGSFAHGEERAIVVGVIEPYLVLTRRLILTYTLEPAGSHGVWGLDDHSFISYIFGSAQLGPAISCSDVSRPQATPTEGSLASAPAPDSITSTPTVREWKEKNMYFSAVAFIHAVKRGPFWEHSPILFNISGIKDGWGKINKGMLKMWDAEVLGKFPVVQHFGFGSLFVWEEDPLAANMKSSIHARQQPIAANSHNTETLAATGTTAPWARSTGVPPPGNVPPTARGHRNADGMSARSSGPHMGGSPHTAAPWASGASSVMRPVEGSMAGMPMTAAPWSSSRASSLKTQTNPTTRGDNQPPAAGQRTQGNR